MEKNVTDMSLKSMLENEMKPIKLKKKTKYILTKLKLGNVKKCRIGKEMLLSLKFW